MAAGEPRILSRQSPPPLYRLRDGGPPASSWAGPPIRAQGQGASWPLGQLVEINSNKAGKLPIVAGLVGVKLWAWKFGKRLDLKLHMHDALVACWEGTSLSDPVMYPRSKRGLKSKLTGFLMHATDCRKPQKSADPCCWIFHQLYPCDSSLNCNAAKVTC